KGRCTFPLRHFQHLVLRHEEKVSLRVDEFADEPGAGYPVHFDSFAGNPLHGCSPTDSPYCFNRMPTTPAARMSSGSGTFLVRMSTTSAPRAIKAVGTSMMARLPRMNAAPAMAPVAAAVSPLTNALICRFWANRR